MPLYRTYKTIQVSPYVTIKPGPNGVVLSIPEFEPPQLSRMDKKIIKGQALLEHNGNAFQVPVLFSIRELASFEVIHE